MGLFNSYNEIEKGLLEMYSQMFVAMIGISEQEARKMAKDLLNQAVEESKKEGSYNLSPNFGDILLGERKAEDQLLEKIAQIIRKNLLKKREEGVRDEDIKWWWNMNDIERRMMLKVDDINKIYMAQCFVENEGMTPEEAFIKVRKFHPVYGDPLDTTHTKGDDRPLPYELKDRINIYIEKRAKSDPGKYKKDIEASPTFNALVRKEIKAGNI